MNFFGASISVYTEISDIYGKRLLALIRQLRGALDWWRQF
jgi:hypothetical protein